MTLGGTKTERNDSSGEDPNKKRTISPEDDNSDSQDANSRRSRRKKPRVCMPWINELRI